MVTETYQQIIPILRILDEAKAREFYVDYLGFTVTGEHRFEANFPLYMFIERNGFEIHLSEHYGDCVPGAAVFIKMTGIAEYHCELTAKDYKYYKPGLEKTFYHALCMDLKDPFGNRLSFNEYLNDDQAEQQ